MTRRALLMLATAALGAVGGGWLVWWRMANRCERESAALRERVALLEKRPASCGPSMLGALAALGQARAPERGASRSGPGGAPASAGDSTSARVRKPFDLIAITSEAHVKAGAALEEMKARVALTDAQATALQGGIDDMNARLGAALDKLVAAPKPAHSRDIVPIAVEALTSIEDADRTFRSALTAEQRTTLDGGEFDIASQVDPMLFLRLMPKRD